MEDLTVGQHEPLFQLVRHQQECKQEIVFALGQGWEVEVQSWDKRTTNDEPIVRVPREIFELWREYNYVTTSERGVGGGSLGYEVSTFMLNKKALDYESFMRKPRIIRGMIKLWQGLVEDVPSLVWGIIGGVVSAVITVMASNWLGLNP